MATSRICSIPNCGKPTRARGWCQAHWLRWSRHGDPMAGGSSRTAAGEYFRDVVLNYEGTECLFWPFDRDSSGYARLGIDGRRFIVSREVCTEHRGPPPTPDHEAAHTCGNGHLACVAKGHLVWKTRTQNFADKLIHDTHNRGERNGYAKITEDQARAVKALKDSGLSAPEIARRCGVTPANARHILCGDSWRWLE